VKAWGGAVVRPLAAFVPFALAVAAAPLPARAAFGSEAPGGFLPVVLALLLLLAALGWWQARGRLRRLDAEKQGIRRERDAAEAALAATPAANYRWHADGREEFTPGPTALFAVREGLRFGDVLGQFAGDDALTVGRAIERLRGEGLEFALSAKLLGGAAVDLVGRRLRHAGGEAALDIVWLVDAAARAGVAAQRDEMRRERDGIRELLDLLPVPVWRRSATDFRLIACNRAYAQAVDAGSPAAVVEEGRELLSGALRERGRGLAERARDSA
jgi:hypothetical protein